MLLLIRKEDEKVGHVARTGKKRISHRVLVGKTERNRQLGRFTCRWEENIKKCLTGIEWNFVD
jgi:hypothetical protein